MIKQNIYLIGFMGTGKSTIAKGLKRITGKRIIEMDALIEEQQKMTISEMFEKYGEEHFRDVESQLIINIKNEGNAIVSCGGGVVVREQNTRNMKDNGVVVLLTAKPETVLERVKENNDRPILKGNMNVEFIEELMNKRRELYMNVADIIVSTDEKSVDSICTEICDTLGKKQTSQN